MRIPRPRRPGPIVKTAVAATRRLVVPTIAVARPKTFRAVAMIRRVDATIRRDRPMMYRVAVVRMTCLDDPTMCRDAAGLTTSRDRPIRPPDAPETDPFLAGTVG